MWTALVVLPTPPLKLARVGVYIDRNKKTISFAYDGRFVFHYRQVEAKKDQLQDVVDIVTGHTYKVGVFFEGEGAAVGGES